MLALLTLLLHDLMATLTTVTIGQLSSAWICCIQCYQSKLDTKSLVGLVLSSDQHIQCLLLPKYCALKKFWMHWEILEESWYLWVLHSSGCKLIYKATASSRWTHVWILCWGIWSSLLLAHLIGARFGSSAGLLKKTLSSIPPLPSFDAFSLPVPDVSLVASCLTLLPLFALQYIWFWIQDDLVNCWCCCTQLYKVAIS